ncbi:MAG TPA: hypothetical protein VF527_06560 [Pyrinomonadaceae bacterium]
MSTISKKIELFANVAIIVVALLLGTVLVKRYLWPASPPPQAAAQQIQAGTSVSVPGVEWTQSDKTMLLVLSDSCRFCTESAGFYQKLAQERAKQPRLRMVAMFPQEVSKGREYLSKLGVTVDDVRQGDLDTVGVRGTPTLILIDKAGKVINSWVGKLPSEKEAEVLSYFNTERASN